MAQSNNLNTELVKARKLREKNLVIEAIEAYQDTLIQDTNGSIHYELAVYLAMQNRFQDAIPYFRYALNRNPENPYIHGDLALTLSQSGQYEEAIDLYKKIAIMNPELIQYQLALGETYRRGEKFEDAVKTFRNILKNHPLHHASFCAMGLAYRDKLDMPSALECLERATGIEPNIAEYHFHFANLLQQVKFYAQALAEIKLAIKLNPKWLEARYVEADILDKQNKYFEAIDAFKSLEKLLTKSIDIKLALTRLYFKVRQYKKSEAMIEAILMLDPENTTAQLERYKILNETNQIEEATQLLLSLSKKHPNYNESFSMLVAMSKNTAFDQDAFIDKLKGFLSKPVIQKDALIYFNFALGHIFDRQEKWDLAFDYYRKGNDEKNKDYLEESSKRYKLFADTVIENYQSRQYQDTKPLHKNLKGIKPIFIVGMPRAGKSILESILAVDRRIYPGGEIGIDKGSSFNFSHSNESFEKNFTEQNLQLIQKNYLNTLNHYAEDKQYQYVVDRMPGNYFDIGLIYKVFPEALIINAIRDPLDLCLFNYFKLYEDEIHFAYNLNNLVFYYKEYLRFINFWKELIPGKIIDINFEDTVKDPIAQGKKITYLLELEWIAPHIDKELEETIASKLKGYQKYIGHWKHYESHLTELIEVLKNKPK